MDERVRAGAARSELLRRFPSVDEALKRPAVRALASRATPELLVEFVRATLEAWRERARAADVDANEFARKLDADAWIADVVLRVDRERRAGLVRVVNATGVVLHTGLGRAPLHGEAAERMSTAARSYVTLEIDRETGERGQRDERVGRLVARLLGCEAAIAVNNNAAAVVLALSAFARGKETVLSRGELVEIGGSFRMPDVMAAAGTTLREVGTTNRTRLADYRAAVGPATALLLKVHTSNYRVRGFVEDTSPSELAELAREAGLSSFYDVGSGHVDAPNARSLDMLGDEPDVRLALESGVDVVSFSGDKLFGGPQSGLLVGRRGPIERLRKSPLYRAMRLDKVTLAGLERTLELLLEGRGDELPTRAMLCADPMRLADDAAQLARSLNTLRGFTAEPVASTSQPGSGSAPDVFLPTTAVRVRHAALAPNALARALRLGEPPVFARVHEDGLLLDPRTLLEGDAERLLAAFRALVP
ncbi:MAG: L-seryl-tRNA(Sec) selenium transferase [Planctomycetes bacterium]|nr:L-seryl-tRNA(Sec) selenium transferase [Planctomycetota bacterium]